MSSGFALDSRPMSKAFTKEPDGEDNDDRDLDADAGMPGEFTNYITPAGRRRLNDELTRLWKVDRPQLVETIAWAASNGDRSENGDYIYGKRKLREITAGSGPVQAARHEAVVWTCLQQPRPVYFARRSPARPSGAKRPSASWGSPSWIPRAARVVDLPIARPAQGLVRRRRHAANARFTNSSGNVAIRSTFHAYTPDQD